MWELGSKDMWDNNGKWNHELEEMCKEGWEPFGSVSCVSGGGSFLGGVADTRPIILFRREVKSDEIKRGN